MPYSLFLVVVGSSIYRGSACRPAAEPPPGIQSDGAFARAFSQPSHFF
jgi:hypothetical protein